jgi:O-Antigen ligase
MALANTTLEKTRFTLLLCLVFLAPLSKFPSLSLPTQNFSSFRLGLYQLLSLVFVAACLPLFLNKKNPLRREPKFRLIFLSFLLTIGFGVTRSTDFPRSGLYALSMVSLCLLLITGLFYCSNMREVQIKKIIKVTVASGVIFSLLGLVQLALSTILPNSNFLLCTGCTSSVFGFPRVNLFAAEPQFFANSLLPAYFISLILFKPKNIWVKIFSLMVISCGIAITFSRGAYLATTIGIIFFLALNLKKRARIFDSIKLAGWSLLGGVIGLILLIGSSALINWGEPNIVKTTSTSLVEHLSLGKINFREDSPSPTPQNVFPVDEVVQSTPSGLIEASSEDRLSAAELATKAWLDNPINIIFGVGPGNLAGYVRQNIEPTAPDDLTVYVQYILVLAELGLAGLGILFFILIWPFKQALINPLKSINQFRICLVIAFAIQLLFFGTLINTMYLWLWLGILSTSKFKVD